MKYFIDTEFIEGFHKPLFGKHRHFIDLISIGIVAEDGREYYAISNEFDYGKASQWVKDNVIEKLEHREPFEYDSRYSKVYDGMQAVRKSGKSNKQIAEEIIDFVNPDWLAVPVEMIDQIKLSEQTKSFLNIHNAHPYHLENTFDCYFAHPEFYGYYADYDWVLFCSLFGTMMDLPKGFPMYCRDLKQEFDELAKALYNNKEADAVYAGMSLPDIASKMKSAYNYPKEVNEHNALADARWIFELYKFICSI